MEITHDYGQVIVTDNNPKLSLTYETVHLDTHLNGTNNMQFELKCLSNKTNSQLSSGEKLTANNFRTISGGSGSRYVSYGYRKRLGQPVDEFTTKYGKFTLKGRIKYSNETTTHSNMRFLKAAFDNRGVIVNNMFMDYLSRPPEESEFNEIYSLIIDNPTNYENVFRYRYSKELDRGTPEYYIPENENIDLTIPNDTIGLTTPNWKSGVVLANTTNLADSQIIDKIAIEPKNNNLQISVVFNITSEWFNNSFQFIHSHDNGLKMKEHKINFTVISQEKAMINTITSNNVSGLVDVYESKTIPAGVYPVDSINANDISLYRTVDVEKLNLS